MSFWSYFQLQFHKLCQINELKKITKLYLIGVLNFLNENYMKNN